jgi:hypothetical protein
MALSLGGAAGPRRQHAVAKPLQWEQWEAAPVVPAHEDIVSRRFFVNGKP